MLEFNYCSKAKSKNTETVVNCDETSGSAEALKVSERINYSQRTYISIFSKDITIFNFIASFIWVEKSHISIEKQSTFVGYVLGNIWKVKSLDSTCLFRLTSYLKQKLKHTLRLIAIFHVWKISKVFGSNFLSLNIIIHGTVEFNAVKKLWIGTLEGNSL